MTTDRVEQRRGGTPPPTRGHVHDESLRIADEGAPRLTCYGDKDGYDDDDDDATSERVENRLPLNDRPRARASIWSTRTPRGTRGKKTECRRGGMGERANERTND